MSLLSALAHALPQTFTARRNRNGLLDTWGGAFWALWALSTWSMFGMRAYV